MEFQSLQTLSLWSLVHDAGIVVGVGIALLAGLVFVNLGLLLPGLLTSLGGHHSHARREYLEFGPVAAPTISEPAPRHMVETQMPASPHQPVQSQPWHRLSGGMALHLAPRSISEEDVVFGEGHHDSVVQRGIDEALACQDMLERAPVNPSRIARALAGVHAIVQGLVRRTVAGQRRVSQASTITR